MSDSSDLGLSQSTTDFEMQDPKHRASNQPCPSGHPCAARPPAAVSWLKGEHMRRSRLLTLLLGATLMMSLAAASPATATYPDHNGLIAFGVETDQGFQLFTVRSGGAGLHQITHVKGDAVHPDWSPDGRWIVFELGHPEGQPFCSVILMRADGTDMRDLTGDRHGCEGQPSFTPDGRHIVFGRFNEITEVEAIWIMNLAGGDRHEITRGIGSGVTDPNVSPDGTTVSFVAFNGRELGQALYTVHLDGSHLRKLTPFRTDVAIKQDWAPNGRRLVFTDNADNVDRSANIATIRPDGTGLRYLTHLDGPEERAYAGGYAPNGFWIVFRLEDHGEFGLFRMRPNGTGVEPILAPTDFAPRFIDWGSSPQA